MRLVPLLALIAACGGGGVDLAVAAPPSFVDVVTPAVADLESAHGITTSLNLAASNVLATQILEGADFDLFISADEIHARRVADQLGLADPVPLARTRLVLVIAPGNPRAVTGVADLGRSDLRVVLAASQTPIGHYTEELLGRAGVTPAAASFEADSQAVVARVGRGEADLGVGYLAGAITAADRVDHLDLAGELTVWGVYYAVLAPHAPAVAEELLARIRADGDRLRMAGFEP